VGGKPRFDQKTGDTLPAIVSGAFIAEMQGIDSVTNEGKESVPRMDVPTEHVMAVFPFVTKAVADVLRM
jgi:hypothetical protein